MAESSGDGSEGVFGDGSELGSESVPAKFNSQLIGPEAALSGKKGASARIGKLSTWVENRMRTCLPFSHGIYPLPLISNPRPAQSTGSQIMPSGVIFTREKKLLSVF